MRFHQPTIDYVARRTLPLALGSDRSSMSSPATPYGPPAQGSRCWAESPLARHVTVFGRSCDIGAMKPDLWPYRWMATQLRIDPGQIDGLINEYRRAA